MSTIAANIKALNALKLVVAIGEYPEQNPLAKVKLDPMADRQVREAIAALEAALSKPRVRLDEGFDTAYLVDDVTGHKTGADWKCRMPGCSEPYLTAIEEDGTCICCRGHTSR